jgi:hypothetical protein
MAFAVIHPIAGKDMIPVRGRQWLVVAKQFKQWSQ